MSLTRPQFQVLYALTSGSAAESQRSISSQTGLSLGTVNTAIRALRAADLIDEWTPLAAGFAALALYRVDNAVILAAGLSTRFAPISYEKPKGLLRVRGEILIERQIEQLLAAGIAEIIVVVGYRQEYFYYLREKYGVTIVSNPEYATRNTNGSIWAVRERLGNTFVCSSDNYFVENPFASHVYGAYYASQYVAGETAEWCLKTGVGGLITGVKVGGRDSWVMLGHVYFDRKFSTCFARILERVYDQPDTAEKHWETIYLDHVKELEMVKREYPDGAIYEFDTLGDVQRFEPHFIENVASQVLTNIVDSLGCERAEIREIYPLKQGATNLSCHFAVGDAEYVYRHPGVGTDRMINRAAEFEALGAAKRLGLDRTFIAGDAVTGWKISKYIADSRPLAFTHTDELRRAMMMSRTLHRSGEIFTQQFDFVESSIEYERLLQERGPIELPGYAELRAKVMRLKSYADADDFAIVPSHNDFFPSNFLVDPSGRMDLIDWEYAGMSDIASDFASFVVSAEISQELRDHALEIYLERPPTATEQRHFDAYVVFAGWCWFVWSLVKEAAGENVSDRMYTYYRHAADSIDEVLTLYERENAA